jgi:hypothetical protein
MLYMCVKSALHLVDSYGWSLVRETEAWREMDGSSRGVARGTRTLLLHNPARNRGVLVKAIDRAQPVIPVHDDDPALVSIADEQDR